MKISIFVFLAFLAYSSFGQVDDRIEAAKAKLEAKAKSTTRPATKPAIHKIELIKRLVLKDGAPDVVKKWFISLPFYRQQEIMSLDREIADSEKEYKSLQRTDVPYHSYGGGGLNAPESAPDQRATYEKSKKLKELWATIVGLRKTRENLKNDETFISVPKLKYEVESFGRIGTAKVTQIVNSKELIVRTNDDVSLWIKGISTVGMVDDFHKVFKETFVCTGTKTYATAIGGSRTVFVIEPIDIDEWIEIDQKVK